MLLHHPQPRRQGRTGQQRFSAAAHELTNAYSSTQVECFVRRRQKLRLDFARKWRLGDTMDADTRNLINHLGAELAGTMEDASAIAATIRGVPNDNLAAVIRTLERAAAKSQALTSAMRALLT